MKKKYKLSLVIVFCAFLLCLFIFFQYQSFLGRQEQISGITYVNGDLSVNYLNGKKYKNQEKLEFSVTNQSSVPLLFYVHLTNISGEKESVFYEFTSTKENFEPIHQNFNKTDLISREEIKPFETIRYTLKVNNEDKKDISFDIDTDLDEMDESFANTILLQNKVEEDDTKDGLIEKLEQYGEMYYFKGNVTNNYVSFGDLLWRIVKINEDKTVKLILNNTTEELVKMKESSNDENFDFNTSPVASHLQNFYQVYLENLDSYIVSTLYCFDDSIISSENNQMEFLSNSRIFDDKMPTNACGGTTLSKKIALLTADEAMFAGSRDTENKDYYLYIDSLQSSWWTMTPYKKDNNVFHFMSIGINGSLERDKSETSSLFVRPVITLNRKVKVSGEGTLEKPYIIETK